MEPMLALGDFMFSLETAPYQTSDDSAPFRWPAQARIGREPALQFVGPGTRTLSLQGVIYPTFKGGLGQMDTLREMANQGEPLILVSGQGHVMGKWVITQVEESRSTFMAAGLPRKITFTLSLQQYGEDH